MDIENIPGIYNKIIEVGNEHVDNRSKMRPSALAHELQLISEDHLKAFGVTIPSLKETGTLGVIVKSEFKVERLPDLNESIKIKTWIGREKHWLYPRWFTVQTLEGEELVKASSLWTFMDEKSRKLSDPSRILENIPCADVKGQLDPPAWYREFPKGHYFEKKRTVQPFEIDHNDHMNNAFYLDWVMDLMDKEYLNNHFMCSLWIEYNRELLEGQDAELFYKLQGDSLYAEGYEKGEKAFSLNIDFKHYENQNRGKYGR